MTQRYLKGRSAMVTGGASGMGRAMALEFAKAGADVAIGSLVSKYEKTSTKGELVNMPGSDEMEATRKEIEALGVKAIACELDVTSVDSVDAFYNAAMDAFGKVDILANAAGITAEQTICGHPDALWDKVMDVNLNGTYRTIKAVLPGMIKNGWGRIINISSTAANVGAPTSGVYCASKAGVLGLSRCVALEGAENGVTCNAICPGWTETTFGQKWMGDIAQKQESRTGDEYISDEKAGNPQKRMIQPSEIGNLAVFLCKDESRGITAQDLTVSAGSLW